MAENKEAKEEISEDELDQIIQDMSKEEESEAPAAKPVLEAVQSRKAQAVSAGQSLTLELNGAINLKLCFKSGERSIDVVCSEEALVCTMADGTEFRIPTGHSKSRKAA